MHASSSSSSASSFSQPFLSSDNNNSNDDTADTSTADTQKRSHFGGKSLSLASSIILTLNNDLGPGMILFPLIMQESGWISLTLTLILMFLVSTFCCTMLCEAVQRIPGNRNFEQRWEYTNLVEHFFGTKYRIPAQILFNGSMQASNIAAMIIAAQVLDVFLVTVFGKSFALDYWHWDWLTADNPHAEDIWNGAETIVSLGYVLTMIVCIPFGYLNLEENMSFQWLSFVALVVLVVEFFVQFIVNLENESHGASIDNVLAFTNLAGQVHVVGSVVFAYSYVVTIPSWLNEKKLNVSVNQAVWYPAFGGFLVKLFTGLLGAWAFVLLAKGDNSNKICHDVNVDGCKIKQGADNILNMLTKSWMPEITIYSSFLFNLLTLIPGIPIISIIVRYNLLSAGVCGPFQSFLWAVVAPWVVTMFTYRLSVLGDICSWAGILVMGFANFVVPAMMYREAVLRYPQPGEAAYAPLVDKLEEEVAVVARMDSDDSIGINRRPIGEESTTDSPFVDAIPMFVQRFVAPAQLAKTFAIVFSLVSVATIILNVYLEVSFHSTD